MNKDIMRQAGFNLEVEKVEKKVCPFCNESVNFKRLSFKNDISYKEYKISGLCQKCQDKTFG